MRVKFATGLLAAVTLATPSFAQQEPPRETTRPICTNAIQERGAKPIERWSVTFSKNRFALRRCALPEELLYWLRRSDDRSLEIVSFADTSAEGGSSQELREGRAFTVRQWFLNQRIAPQRINTDSSGRRLCPDKPSKCRKVEIYFRENGKATLLSL